MLPKKPTEYPLLLQVFCFGVKTGLISKNEIVAWADEVIEAETEPDYFFIEVSLSKDVNELLSVLNTHESDTTNIIVVRAIYGIVYTKLVNDEISLEQAINIVDRYEFHESLTCFESSNIYSLDFYLYDDLSVSDDMMNETKSMLVYYKGFNLQNYEQWIAISQELDEVLKIENEKAEAANEAFQKKWKKQQAKRKLIRSIPFGILLLIAFVIIVVDVIVYNTGTIHAMRIWYMNIFGLYFIARWCYPYWKQRG
ncbi:MAG: hypothetical protein JST32_13795 [Bacteroidetes bacterium]|nr:hypothetical protein [Bacteroidota bacterium]